VATNKLSDTRRQRLVVRVAGDAMVVEREDLGNSQA
jgi:hypothetical protein